MADAEVIRTSLPSRSCEYTDYVKRLIDDAAARPRDYDNFVVRSSSGITESRPVREYSPASPRYYDDSAVRLRSSITESRPVREYSPARPYYYDDYAVRSGSGITESRPVREYSPARPCYYDNNLTMEQVQVPKVNEVIKTVEIPQVR